MNTTEIKAGKIRQRTYRQQRSKKSAAVVMPGTIMCLPLLDTGIIKINTREKFSSGGYEPVATVTEAAEHMQELSPALGAYHDFIHYNYGAASQRYYTSSGSDEQE